jgi:anti-sigma-K factor RskA
VQPSEPSHGHLDDETLALLALGETVPAVDADGHLRSCALCRAELDQLSALVHTGRTVTAEDLPQRPPPRVWDAITAAASADQPAEDAPSERTTLPLPGPAAPPAPRADVRSLDDVRRRSAASRRRWGLVAAAACLGVLAGAVGTWLTVGRDTGDDLGDSVTVATGSLDPLAVEQATGRATVAETQNGRVLAVSVSGIPEQVEDGGFYEVWLLDEGATRLVSLGNLGPGHRGTFNLPDSLDLSEYPVVDVSVEPADGDPSHSAVSAVRGVLS